jgi:hypothetical protein
LGSSFWLPQLSALCPSARDEEGCSDNSGPTLGGLGRNAVIVVMRDLMSLISGTEKVRFSVPMPRAVWKTTELERATLTRIIRCNLTPRALHETREQRPRPWRIHELTHDFRLEDVWAPPTPSGPQGAGAATLLNRSLALCQI